MNRKAYIYALYDPRLPEVPRYVGRTVCQPQRRLADHMTEVGTSHKNNWIAKLASEGILPVIKILEETIQELSYDLEIQWIASLKSKGFRLTNSSGGGRGGWPSDPVPWNKGKKMSAEYCAALSEAGKARGIPPEQQAKMLESRAGYKHSEETKARIRASVTESHKTNPRSPESQKNFSQSRKGKPGTFLGKKHTDETKAKIAEYNRNMPEKTRQKIADTNRDRKQSPETIAKRAETKRKNREAKWAAMGFEPHDRICVCGCDQAFRIEKPSQSNKQFIVGHNFHSPEHPGGFEPYEKPCACGCGEMFTVKKPHLSDQRFITGHNNRVENPMSNPTAEEVCGNARRAIVPVTRRQGSQSDTDRAAFDQGCVVTHTRIDH